MMDPKERTQSQQQVAAPSKLPQLQKLDLNPSDDDLELRQQLVEYVVLNSLLNSLDHFVTYFTPGCHYKWDISPEMIINVTHMFDKLQTRFPELTMSYVPIMEVYTNYMYDALQAARLRDAETCRESGFYSLDSDLSD